MQLKLKPFYNIQRQQNNFEWSTEHQKRFEEIEKLLTEKISNTIQDPNQPFYARCDASNFGIGAALLQSHNGTNKMNLISASSRFFTQTELRLYTLMIECTAIIYTLTDFEFLILGSTHPTISYADQNLLYFFLYKNQIDRNNRSGNFSNNRNRSYSNSRNQLYQNNRLRDYSKNRSRSQRSNYNNYPNRSRDNSQKRNSNYSNRRRNYSKSPHRNNNRYPNCQNKYGSNTPKHQRQINQVQTAEETNSDPLWYR